MDNKEFKKYCEDTDDNLKTKWDYEKFPILCGKCKSKKVKLVDDLVFTEGSSCPTCGFSSFTRGKIIVKCLDCGNAMQVLDAEELENG